ncbi:zinc transporter permease subunit ZevB [Pasteurellaceae bacterium 22721_9_1]
MQIKKYRLVVLLCLLIAGICFLFPLLFQQVVGWQKDINQLLSQQLHQIKQEPISAGIGLVAASFLYGVFHALGPGHGKFIITSYLSTHQSKLATSMRLTFLSSLMQGIVAIAATSIIVVLLNLSSAQFKTSQLWLERVAYGLIFLLGLQWLWQAIKNVLSQKGKPKIRAIQPISQAQLSKSAVKNPQVFHQHSENCACGHQHLPNSVQLEGITDFKSQCLVIFSIGMRPCTGAIFILFLSYMLDLYWWGMLATMAMALGTGITLSSFALLVQYARQTAVKLGKWYVSPQFKQHIPSIVKLIFALLLMGFALSLMYATTLQSSGGALLLGR